MTMLGSFYLLPFVTVRPAIVAVVCCEAAGTRQGRAGRKRRNQRQQRTNHMGKARASWAVLRAGAGRAKKGYLNEGETGIKSPHYEHLCRNSRTA